MISSAPSPGSRTSAPLGVIGGSDVAFACCPECGVVRWRLRGVPPQYGRPAGTCPECGSTTYWTASPLAREILKRREGLMDATSRHGELARPVRIEPQKRRVRGGEPGA